APQSAPLTTKRRPTDIPSPDADAYVDGKEPPVPLKRARGRPKGSKNKPRQELEVGLVGKRVLLPRKTGSRVRTLYNVNEEEGALRKRGRSKLSRPVIEAKNSAGPNGKAGKTGGVAKRGRLRKPVVAIESGAFAKKRGRGRPRKGT
ncbi:MAG: hypothetical protein Q9174_003695, partial [Haloplaca sp. 1 TL-2023]